MKTTDPFEMLLKAAGVPPKKPEEDEGDDDSAGVEDDDAPAGNASVPGDDDEGVDGGSAEGGDEEVPPEDGDHDDDGTPDAQDEDADGDGVDDAEDADFGAGTGDVQGLYAEVAEAERAYYAARGFHGAGHHKAEAALDAYHKVVRKMVRALTGATGESPDQEMPEEGEEDPTAQGPDGDAEGDGDGVPDEGVDEDQDGEVDEGGEGDDGVAQDGQPQTMTKPPTGMAVGKPHPNAGKPQKVAAPQQPGAGGPPGKGAPPGKPGAGGPPQKKKGKPFGKSEARLLRKGLYSYDDPSGRNGAVPDKFLYDYLCGFIEEAYEHEARESAHARFARNVDYMAERVMHELVMYMPKNANLTRAATKYNITADVVGTILRAKKIIAAPNDEGAQLDREAHIAMGHYDIPRTVDPILRSMAPAVASAMEARGPWLSPDPLAKGAEGVHAAASRFRDGRALLVDDTVDPMQQLAKGHTARARQLWDYREAEVATSVDAECLIHGSRDLTKAQNLHNPYARCSCPRS
jgi:hypothetical protein